MGTPRCGNPWAGAAALRSERHSVAYPFIRRRNEARLGRCRQQLSEVAFHAAWSRGTCLSVEQATRVAVGVLDQLTRGRANGHAAPARPVTE